MVEGILCIDKPQDWTSFDVVARVRRLTSQKRTGHGGTLDPMATGVLPVFLGSATKTIDLIENHDKRYTASAKLGITTDTLDTTGQVLSNTKSAVTLQQLQEVLAGLTGDIMQIPPMYSAVQIDGVRLYKLARQGKEVERPARPAFIEFINLIDFNYEEQSFTIDVKCSKGTYIRTLIDDAGKILGCGAVMSALRRTEALGFSLENVITLEELERAAENRSLGECLISVDYPFRSLPSLNLQGRQGLLFTCGLNLNLVNLPKDLMGMHRIYYEGRFAGLAQPDIESGVLKIKKLLYSEV